MDQDRGVVGKLRPTTAARLAWSLWASAFGLSVASTLVRQTPNSWFNATFFALATTGAVIAWRRPANPIGWLYLAMSFLGALTTFAQQYAIRGLLEHPGSLPGAVYLAWLEQWSFWFVFPAGIALVLLLFPTGRPASPRWRPVVWISLACALLMVVGSMFSPGRLSDALRPPSGPGADFGVQNPFGIGALGGALNLADAIGRLGGFLFIVIAAVGLVFRLLRARGDEREQLKWVAFVGSAIAVGVLGTIFLGSTGPFGLPGSPALQDFAFAVLLAGFVVGLPVATAIAVLKYRLYDIDIVINKTLLFGAMAAFITLVYVAIVVGIGHLVGTSGKPNLGLSILATALVAVAFQPVRERVQRVANRLVYGKRATPYEVMADFSGRMAGALSVGEILPKMAEAAARGVGAAHGRVRLRLPGGREQIVAWPDSKPVDRTDVLLPVSYAGDPLGDIAVTKSSGEAVTPAEQKLLADLAAQAGLVLHNVRLTIELQGHIDEVSAQAAVIRASRQRIVAARHNEQQHLERTIHSGAETQLHAIKQQLRQVEALLSTEPSAAASRLDELTDQAQLTLEQLRDVARGIYPPLLRDDGLGAALEAYAAKTHSQVQLTARGLGRYQLEAEAAIYFCCVEALRSATGPATIHIERRGDAVEFSIAAGTLDLGSRFQDLEDRMAALGGSLQVLNPTALMGRVPVPSLEPVA
jgi:signal transduction histidine kinase